MTPSCQRYFVDEAPEQGALKGRIVHPPRVEIVDHVVRRYRRIAERSQAALHAQVLHAQAGLLTRVAEQEHGGAYGIRARLLMQRTPRHPGAVARPVFDEFVVEAVRLHFVEDGETPWRHHRASAGAEAGFTLHGTAAVLQQPR